MLKDSGQRTLAGNSPSHLYMHKPLGCWDAGPLGCSHLHWCSMPFLSLASILTTFTLPFCLSQAPGVVQTTYYWGRAYNSQFWHVLHSKSKGQSLWRASEMGALPWERSTSAFKERGLQRVTPHIHQENGALEAERIVTETQIETLSQAKPSHSWSRLNMMVVVGSLMWVSKATRP